MSRPLLTPEQERMRQLLMGGVATVNDGRLIDHEARAAEGRAKMQRKLMAADALAAVAPEHRRALEAMPSLEERLEYCNMQGIEPAAARAVAPKPAANDTPAPKPAPVVDLLDDNVAPQAETVRYGATPEEWDRFANLGWPLLPVVSDPRAELSPGSSLPPANRGKVPSIINAEGKVVGVLGWTTKKIRRDAIESAKSDPRLGICVRLGDEGLHAIDVDVSDPQLALKIGEMFPAGVMRRGRGDSPRFLIPVRTKGALSKARFQTSDGGAVELLGAGQQFVAAGTHPKGQRYTWSGETLHIVDDLPALWEDLKRRFAVGDAPGVREHTAKERAAQINVPDADEALVARAGEWLKTAPRSVKGAGGDDTAFRVAASLKDMGLSYQQACELMRSEAWDYGCGWRDGRLEEKPIKSAYKYGTREPGAAVVKPSDFSVMAPAAVAALPTPVVVAPAAPAKAPQKMLAFAASGGANAGYVIKGMLQRSSYALVYGAPGSGKTFTVLDMAYHVAAGEPWMGKRVKQGAVLYLPFEGAGGMRGRAAALRQHYGDWDVPLYFDDAGYNLREASGRQALGAAIAQLPTPPVMIVIDTLAHALCGGDENSAQDVSAFNAGVQALIQATGACVVVIHHPGKNVANGARGSSALLGAVDTEMCVADRRITPTKQRDVELGEPVGFQLKTISVGIDADGDLVTSCVVVPNAVAPSASGASKLKPGSVQRLAYETLKDLRPNNDPVTDAEWKLACAEFLPSRRQAWSDTKMRLRHARLIEQDEDGLWMRRME